MTGIDRDVLLCRVLEGEASPEDWAAFRALAQREPQVWRDLAEAQQDLAALEEAVAQAVRPADRIEAPVERHLGEHLSIRSRAAVTWAGWAVAAMVMIAAVLRPAGNALVPEPGGAVPGVQIASLATPEDALRAYFARGGEQGRVLGEVAEPMVLQYNPVGDGRSVEVLYLRQILERAIVEDAIRLRTDDAGHAVPLINTTPVKSPWTY